MCKIYYLSIYAINQRVVGWLSFFFFYFFLFSFLLQLCLFKNVLVLIKTSLIHQGPVVQSIVSLTSSLSGQLVKCFMTLQPKTLIFCVEKWEKLLHCKSFSHFFNKKYWHILDINVWNFNETLTNDVVSFEQPGPDRKNWRAWCPRYN